MGITRSYTKRIKYDKFIGTRAIMTLDEQSFQDYLSDQSIALVMFYNPRDPESQRSKPHFVKAAKTTPRENRRAFAAVNCLKEPELCASQNAYPELLPVLKLYARGKFVSNHGRVLDYREIRGLVEDTPFFPHKAFRE
ncbi:protein disulfide-isomerase a5 [Plakobranchus ocellatus]|uniref:Protein disulfide-isomerase a5 n=1 Tax=Plakobranchus ocellatus TaxID=259542 RepID=A0AAV4DV37_9GAST|nr:protein disulfide-isomerase a5 [Plakobranchus ocellatus]